MTTPYQYPSGFYVGQKIIVVAPRVIVTRKYCEMVLYPGDRGEVIDPPDNFEVNRIVHGYHDAVNVRLPGYINGVFKSGLIDSFLLMSDTEFTDLALLLREAQ